MAERFALSGYKNAQCSTIYEGDQTVLNMVSGRFDEYIVYMMPSKFNYQAWYQARLLLNGLPHSECYRLEANGDALISGWKTTPLFAVSLWTCG
ncbi:hypothetical protein SUGI_0376060 [Cryptomeria japonica]|nr:hypothetical protein SUGI_0376060 [Cryptomeria japonica]